MANLDKCLCCGGELQSRAHCGLYTIFVCSTCGSGFTFPRTIDSESSELYSQNYYQPYWIPALSQRLKSFVIFRNRRARVLSLKEGGKILDFGCGGGDFLAELDKKQWELYGVDTSQAACELARKRGVTAFCGELKAAQYQSDFFDFVTAHHVIEHLSDPIEVLREMNRIVKPGGYVYIEVPNYTSFWSFIFKMTWQDVPRHMNHFSFQGLKHLVEASSFRFFKKNNAFFPDVLYSNFLMMHYIDIRLKNKFLGLLGATVMFPVVSLVSLLGNREAIGIVFIKPAPSGGQAD